MNCFKLRYCKFLIGICLTLVFFINVAFLKAKSSTTPQNVYLSGYPNENKNSERDMKFDHLAQNQKEIFQLLQKIEESPYEFIRNGVSYPGNKAGKHFRWKYSYGINKIQEAEQFIEYVASKSMESGEKYFVRFSDEEIYSLGDVLHNELRLLRES